MQESLIDIREAAYYKEVAAHKDWHVLAHRAMTALAASGKPFTADDFREAMGEVKPAQIGRAHV